MSNNPSNQLATLLVSCPDRRGRVAALAQVLAGHGANILDASQHTDSVAKLFLQRIRFDASELLTDKGTLQRAIDEVSTRFSMQSRLFWNDQPKRVAIFVSKYDHCLVDLMLRHRSGELQCDIAAVISNHRDLQPLAAQFDAPFYCIPVTEQDRPQSERQTLDLLARYEVDLLVLARYMQILSPSFIAGYEHRIINIHHSFLPAFMGAKPYHQAHERGVKIIGVTAHYATENLDQGPIIEQDVVRCSHRDQVSDLIRKGKDLEKVVLARAVRWHVEDRILVYGNKTVVFD
jgi:formyltetrahydrofolate deformylase